MKFTDKNNNLVELEIEYEERLSISGSIKDQIEPKTDEQKEFLDLWEKYHFKSDYPKEKIEELAETITTEFMEDVISLENDDEIVKLLEHLELDLPDSIYIACIKEFELSVEDLEAIENCSYARHEYEVQGRDYIIGNDEEMDDLWDTSLDGFIDECILPEMPEHVRLYFDSDRYKDDCRYDGRANTLARYDGCESEQETPDGTIYLYRV